MVHRFHEKFGPLLIGDDIANAVHHIVTQPPHVHISNIVVRHPIYLGAILFYLSFLVVFFSTVTAFVWAVIILFYIYLCRHEEKLLMEKFGNDYEQYRSETPMLLPRLIRRKKL